VDAGIRKDLQLDAAPLEKISWRHLSSIAMERKAAAGWAGMGGATRHPKNCWPRGELSVRHSSRVAMRLIPALN